MGTHIGRHWPNAYEAAVRATVEETCPCPKECCGLIDIAKIDPDCPQHSMTAARSMRTSHREEDCPCAPADS